MCRLVHSENLSGSVGLVFLGHNAGGGRPCVFFPTPAPPHVSPLQSAGMMVDVRPWPKAFRPPPPPEQQQQAQQQADGGDPPQQAQQAQQAQHPRCFYFMGLSKKKVRSVAILPCPGCSA